MKRIKQILINFVSNALKFTPESGKITIFIKINQIQNSYQKEKEKFVNFEINVRDTGVGISSEGIDKLFINFGKLTENEQLNKSGTGLGLSICKKIVQQMGGKISCSSEIGKGTEFKIKLSAPCMPKHVERDSS